MAQMLLFPDPRPLVERLGAEFFRQAPEGPGVYVMRDEAGAALYVGKAKNLRKRLASYRVANPQRLARRHLRLLRRVQRIELRPCVDEAAALENESALLRTLRPPFNRAGTWPAPTRYLGWRVSDSALDLAVMTVSDSRWNHCGPLGAGAGLVRAALARVIWCSLHPESGVAGLPEGWFIGRHPAVSSIALCQRSPFEASVWGADLERLLEGHPESFCQWVLECTSCWTSAFDRTARDADLEALTEFAAHRQRLRAERLAFVGPLH